MGILFLLIGKNVISFLYYISDVITAHLIFFVFLFSQIEILKNMIYKSGTMIKQNCLLLLNVRINHIR